MEYAHQLVSSTAGTLLVYWVRLGRRLLLRGKEPTTNRFVSFQQRCWSSDLIWSKHFWEAIHEAKWSHVKANSHDSSAMNWKGIPNIKDPFSLASYPLLIGELRPATIIELGAYTGGSALWLADMLDVHGIDGRIYSFEIRMDRIKAQHPKVEFRWVDTNDLNTFDAQWLAALPHPWLVIEDAHQNVCNVLAYFNKLMRPGDYLVVEDTHAYHKYKKLKRFMSDHNEDFLVDTRYADMFGYNVTWHPNSYFKKVR